MTCKIVITSVVGIGMPIPSKIQVSGTAVDCDSVVVVLQCTAPNILTLVVPVVGGSWFAEFTNVNNQCQCTGGFHVQAQCATDPTCQNERRGDLICKPGPPPPPPPPPPCCGAGFIIAAAIAFALAAAAAVGILALQICLHVAVPPFLWFIVAVLGGVGFLIMLICYLACIFSGCGCPSKCDWLLIGWYSPLVATFVAVYLVHCCGGVWWFLILGFALAWLLAFLAWVKECSPKCIEIVGHVLGALGVALIITGYLDSIPAIHACALSIFALIGIMVTTLGLIAAKYCS